MAKKYKAGKYKAQYGAVGLFTSAHTSLTCVIWSGGVGDGLNVWIRLQTHALEM